MLLKVKDMVVIWLLGGSQKRLVCLHGKALKGIRKEVELVTKFGIGNGDGRGKWEIRGDPAYVRAACETSLKRLDVDCIDLYYQHRIDREIPIEITMGELKKLVDEGKIKYIGLSEVSASTIRRAHSVHPITAVQLEWSLWSRDVARDVEEGIDPTCRELGIGIFAYSPLGRGFPSLGPKIVDSFSNDDHRKMGELKKLVGEGKIKYIGLSEASASTIRWAHADHPITAVQLEWSLWSRNVEEDVVPTSNL